MRGSLDQTHRLWERWMGLDGERWLRPAAGGPAGGQDQSGLCLVRRCLQKPGGASGWPDLLLLLPQLRHSLGSQVSASGGPWACSVLSSVSSWEPRVGESLTRQTGVRGQAPGPEQGRVVGPCEGRGPPAGPCAGHRQTALLVLARPGHLESQTWRLRTKQSF